MTKTKQDQIEELQGTNKVLEARLSLIDAINAELCSQKEKIKEKLVYIEQISSMAIKSPDYINEDVRMTIIQDINIKCNE